MEQSFKSAALTEIREGHSPLGQLKSLSCRDTEKRKERKLKQTWDFPGGPVVKNLP